MATLAQADARWRAENPINSPGYVMSQAAYDAMAADRAATLLVQMNQQEAEAARALLVQQFTAGRATLQADLDTVNARIAANTALSATELRVGFRDVLTALVWISDRIADGTILIKQ